MARALVLSPSYEFNVRKLDGLAVRLPRQRPHVSFNRSIDTGELTLKVISDIFAESA